MRRLPTPRPGVTAAATTAVFATGDGPGLTAFATTAVLATGWPMTPTRPTRAALTGISGSYGRIGLDRGDDCLHGYPSVGDQLAAGAARCRREGRSPQVLPDEHAGGASRLHRGGEVFDVVLGQELGQFGFEGLELAQLRDVGQLRGVDGTVVGFGQ